MGLVAAALGGLLLVGAYLAVWGHSYGLDLSVYRDASLSWRHGHNPYLSRFTVHSLPFTYPPFALLLLAPSTLVSFHVAQVSLWTLSIGSTTCAVAFVLRDGGLAFTRRTWTIALVWTCVSLLVMEPARSGLDYGQVEFMLMFLIVGDLLVVPERFKGVAIGVASAVKLTPLVFVLVLVARRDFKAAARALLTFAVLTSMTWLFWPDLSARFWRTDVAKPGRVGEVAYIGNQSILGVFHRPPFIGSPAEALWIGTSIIAIVASVFIAWRCAEAGLQALAMIAVALGGLLASPISWSHHWVWVVLIPPALYVTRNKGESQIVRGLLWGVVAISVLGPYWWFSSGWQSDALGALLPALVILLLITWAAVEMRRISPNSVESSKLASQGLPAKKPPSR